jgi:hypothetical protein
MVSMDADRKSRENPAFEQEDKENPAHSIPNRKRHEKSVLEIIREDAACHRKPLIIAVSVILLLLTFLFSSIVKEYILIVAFIAIGAVSRMWQRFVPIAIGVELVMLFTVIAGILFGPFAGLIVGFLSLSISTLVTEEDISKMWPAFIAIAIVGYLSGAMAITDISLYGLMFTVFYDVFISIIYAATGHSIIKTLIFDATHIAFNYFVFYHIAPNLLKLLA